ncbi:MAG: LamG-like jellyroll fold domain-containing protein [Planctomycetota bacterium]|jgi:hypothetical protein
MCRKLICLVSFVVLLSIAGSVSAELVAHWMLDETSGTTAADSTGNGHDGTVVGTANWVAGMIGGALDFDGSSTSVHINNQVAQGTWTLTMWLKPRDIPYSGGYYAVWHSDGWSGGTLHLHLRDQGWGAAPSLLNADFNTGPDATSTTTLQADEWYHFALTVTDEGGIASQLYINGVLENEGSGGNGGDFFGPGTFGDWNNEDRYYHGLLDDIRIYDHVLSETEILGALTGMGWPYASKPTPEDETLLTEFMMGILGTTLSWKPGDFAESHNVYFGDDFDTVNDGTEDTFQGNQADTYFLVGYGYMPNDPLPDGLVPGTTYYWRIDEVNDTEPNSPWKGDVWSFSLPPTKAYIPTPSDGSKFIDPNADLSWQLGMGGVVQTMYLDEDYDAVNNGTIDGISVTGTTTYDPGPLELDTIYYWRVETSGAYGPIKGDVWSFKTTLPGLGTIVHERWDGISSVPELRNHWKFPNNPDAVEILNRFSWDLDFEGYAARIYGWVYAPSTGDYTFWLCTDDNGELWLSTDDDPSNMRQIAQESSYQGANVWGTGEEQSELIPLVAGNRYYIEALWQEGTGGDHCMVAWRGPGIEGPTIIPGTNLSPYRPLKAYGAKPTNRATGVTQTPILEWKPGIQASSHEVYFGTDEDSVRNATKTSSEYIGPRALGDESYDPGKLAWESTYYWRVDEVNNSNPESPWVGSVWSFTTAGYAIVDDFEDYNATDKQIWAVWHDGLGYFDLDGVFHPGNGTGSAVGDEDNDITYMEETIVHGGNMQQRPD